MTRADQRADTPRPRPTAHTFEQINWENAEQETRIGVLQEMVAILLNRIEAEAAAEPAAAEPPDLVSAIAYALARADLPTDTETSRDYATRLAPLVQESGWIGSPRGVTPALDVERLAEALRNLYRGFPARRQAYFDAADIAAEYARLGSPTSASDQEAEE